MTTSSVTLVQLTDPHLLENPAAEMLGINTNDHLDTVIQHIASASQHPALLIATGDLVQDSSEAAYVRFMAMASSLRIPIHALPGNHDHLPLFRHILKEAANPVIDIGAWRIIMLNSAIPGKDNGHLGADQLTLLKEAAHVDHNRHVLVAMHHNPVPLGSAWLDTMTINNSATLFAYIADLPRVRGLLWGHVHQAYDATLPHPANADNNLILMATPATCFQFAPNSSKFGFDDIAPGYRWITLHDDGRIDTSIERVHTLTRRPHKHVTGY